MSDRDNDTDYESDTDEILPLQPGLFNVRWRCRMEHGEPAETEKFSVWKVNTDEVGGIYKISDDLKTMVSVRLEEQEYGDMRVVPEGAWCLPFGDFQRKYFFRQRIPKPTFDQGLEMDEWVDHIRDQCLTIQDIKELKHNEQIKVLVMDRNLGDVVCEENSSNTLFDPEVFFRYNSATYTHCSGLKGSIHYYWNEEDYEEKDFEFDLEYQKDMWYPLQDGCLPPQDSQGFSTFKFDTHKPWEEFPPSTRVGFRGPMLLWQKLSQTPKVWWYKDWCSEEVDE